MYPAGIMLTNTSLIGAVVTEPVSISHGMQGVVVCTAGADLDPATTIMTVNLRMPGVSGSGYIVVHSSKVLSNRCSLGPVYFPAGEYVVRTLGGSSVTGAFVGIYPTL